MSLEVDGGIHLLFRHHDNMAGNLSPAHGNSQQSLHSF